MDNELTNSTLTKINKKLVIPNQNNISTMTVDGTFKLAENALDILGNTITKRQESKIEKRKQENYIKYHIVVLCAESLKDLMRHLKETGKELSKADERSINTLKEIVYNEALSKEIRDEAFKKINIIIDNNMKNKKIFIKCVTAVTGLGLLCATQLLNKHLDR